MTEKVVKRASIVRTENRKSVPQKERKTGGSMRVQRRTVSTCHQGFPRNLMQVVKMGTRGMGAIVFG